MLRLYLNFILLMTTVLVGMSPELWFIKSSFIRPINSTLAGKLVHLGKMIPEFIIINIINILHIIIDIVN